MTAVVCDHMHDVDFTFNSLQQSTVENAKQFWNVIAEMPEIPPTES